MRRIVIMGAGGRDFHDFNVVFRDDPETDVVAFTAAQIPGIADRRYPPSLAGPLYPDGIPIHPEEDLAALIDAQRVDEVVLAYSDLSHTEVMHKASAVLAAGADFRLAGPKQTMLESQRPVVAVCAVRTGSGKSQTSRRVGRILRDAGPRRRPRPAPDAVRRPRGDARPAVRVARRHRRRSSDDRGARGVRGLGRGGHGRLRRRRLRRDPRARRGGGRPDRLGRRQQRPSVLPTRPADRRRRPAASRTRAHLPPGRDEPPDGRRGRREQGRQRRPDTGRAGARRRRLHQPGSGDRAGELPRDARARPLARRRGGARDRGRADDHPRRDAVRGRDGRRATGRRRRPRRSAALRGRIDRGDVPALPAHRLRAPGDGLLGRAAARARADDQRDRLRRRHLGDAGRPHAPRRLTAPDSPRDLRARGGRQADARGRARSAGRPRGDRGRSAVAEAEQVARVADDDVRLARP